MISVFLALLQPIYSYRDIHNNHDILHNNYRRYNFQFYPSLHAIIINAVQSCTQIMLSGSPLRCRLLATVKLA